MSLLRRFEGDRASGRLQFEGREMSGEVWLVGGSPLDDEAQLEAMERLLQLETGEYQFIPALPPLAMSRGDDRVREGRLGVHAVADLMEYCEECGLTGSLVVRRREREAYLGYRRGELVDIRVDGKARDDLLAVFEWEAGEFRIELTSGPRAAAEDDSWAIRAEQLREDAGSPLAVEVSLDQIVEEGRSRRPSNLPPPKVRAGERKPRPDATVRIVYLGGPEPITPPAAASAPRAEDAPELPPLNFPPPPAVPSLGDEDEPGGFVAEALGTFGWVAAWAAILLVALAVFPHFALTP